MLKYFYVLIICFPIHIGATSYYINDLGNSGDVFTTSIGSNTNSGLTPSTPKLSLTNLFATYSLGAGDIVYIDVDTLDDTVEKDEVFGSVEAVKTVSDLFMPLSGEVIEFNEELEDEPELVNKDPYGKGWMIKLTISDDSQIADLLDAQTYQDLIGG